MQGRSDKDAELLDAGALVGHLVPEGTVHRFLADHRGELFPDEMFEDLFRSGRGRPSVPADVIATVMVLQSLEGRSDRDALDALRTDIRWKVAAGLALDHEGFHPTVLTLWRNKLRASDSPQRIFDAVRAVVAETGVLAGKTRRALDSTLLDDAVATQDTVTQLCSAIRRVRKAIPETAGVEVTAHDYDAGGKPSCAWDDPGSDEQHPDPRRHHQRGLAPAGPAPWSAKHSATSPTPPKSSNASPKPSASSTRKRQRPSNPAVRCPVATGHRTG